MSDESLKEKEEALTIGMNHAEIVNNMIDNYISNLFALHPEKASSLARIILQATGLYTMSKAIFLHVSAENNSEEARDKMILYFSEGFRKLSTEMSDDLRKANEAKQ